jgi:DeoR/GlpR family transcriptional regulator of sugar metabolism
MLDSASNGTAAELGDERRERISAVLATEGRVVATDLAARLRVSLDTIRRDLQELEDAGALRRVRGGALPVAARFTERRGIDAPAKEALAELAARLIPSTGVVAVAGGTTLLALARHWPSAFGGTVVTTSPDLALALPPRVEVVLPGGRLHPEARTLVGADAVDALRRVRADLCLLGACSLHPEAGLGAVHREEAQAMGAIATGAGRVAVVAAAAKLEATSPFTVAPAEALDALVTDAPAAAVAPWAARGVEVLQP